MNTAEESPIFGIRIDGCRYTIRPSAYALLRDDQQRIAVVRAARGWFLPGGGIEEGETAEEAVVREAAEECGLVIAPQRIVATATEIVHAPAGTSGVDKESIFFDAVIVGTIAASEIDHELAWWPVAEAAERLSHRSHRWVVERPLHPPLRTAGPDNIPSP